VIKASRISREAICPYCQTPSRRRHSQYQRNPQALPCAGEQIHLVLVVQRYFCKQPKCSRSTFAERIPDVVQSHARRTVGLERLLQALAFEMSAEAVARVSQRMKVQVSGDSILRMLRATPVTRDDPVRVLGVDDWAFRKGQEYGTLLVDLEKRRPIDLLPDRSQDTLKAWLRSHPEVELVTRDRSLEYKAGMQAGAPQAIQIADRWHLLHNLREKLQQVLAKQLKKAPGETQQHSPNHARRQKYFEIVKELHAQGYSQRVIARALGIARGTVVRYLEEDQVPDWQTDTLRPTSLDPYARYLHQRWRQGCRDVTLLWKEVQDKGYRGPRKNVYRFLKRFRSGSALRSSSQMAWLFIKAADKLSPEEERDLQSICQRSPSLCKIYQLTQAFQNMIAQQSAEELEPWLTQMETCGIQKLRNFAIGLRQDQQAVEAALQYAWSNGQVEGQINRLKTIKRQMYGRAKFDLLRIRVLGPP